MSQAEAQASLEAIKTEIRRRATDKALAGGIEKARARCKTLVGFIKEAWPILEPGTPFVYGWHIGLIAAHLEAITRGTFVDNGRWNRLLINVPPGMMKSLLVSVLWPAWEWGPGGLPHYTYVSTSFSDLNVVRDSRKMRDLVNSEWYQSLWPKTELVRSGENDFANVSGGWRQGRAFGSLTGGRGHRLLIDDPHSTETAESEADRKKAIRIFRESVPSRINDAMTSAIVIIMQRLHEQDVSGTAVALGMGYTHVMLPMEFEPERRFESPLGDEFSDPRTKEGELIFPGKFPRETVERDKAAMGSVAVAGQYQQRPTPRGGLTFQRHWFKPMVAAPSGCRWVRGWDLAASEDQGAAFTCGVMLGRDHTGRFIIADVVRDRVANPETLILNMAAQDKVRFGSHEIDFPQDPGAAGKVQSRAIASALAGHLVFYSPESGDKVTRALPVAAQAEAGNFYYLEGQWNEAFFGELVLFPNSAFKDQIDALSRAFGRFVVAPAAAIVAPIITTTPRVAFGDHPGGLY